MFIVHREDTAELESAVFGSGRSLYTKQVASAPDTPIWIVQFKSQSAPIWEPAETRYVASFKVQEWLDQMTTERIDQISLLAPRDGELILATCTKVIKQQHADGARSLCFVVEEGKVTVCESSPPLDAVVTRKTAWQSKQADLH